MKVKMMKIVREYGKYPAHIQMKGKAESAETVEASKPVTRKSMLMMHSHAHQMVQRGSRSSKFGVFMCFTRTEETADKC